VLEATSFHPSRRAKTHLKIMAAAGRIDRSRIDVVLDLVGLSGDANRKVGGFSMGMRQRLDLAGAMLGDPGVLILDEPANGLDPQGIAWLREFLRHLAGEGRTVLVSSHLLAEMSQTVDDVVILSEGHLMAQGPLASLTAGAASSMRVRTPEADRLATVLAHAQLTQRREAPDVIRVEGVGPETLGPLLAHNQVVIYELTQESSTLESMFLSLTSGLGFGGTPPPPPPGPPQGSPPGSPLGPPPGSPLWPPPGPPSSAAPGGPA
jgi:ABC-2 type transport system ATP-binding protein